MRGIAGTIQATGSVGTMEAPSGLMTPARLGWVAGCALLVAHAGAVALQHTGTAPPAISAVLVEGAIYGAIVWLVVTGRIAITLSALLAVAVLMHLPLLVAAPYFSSDIYRYVWDGRVQGAGINPYLYVPNDPVLAGLRDTAIWPLINRAAYATTIYPPAAEALFFLVTRIGASVIAMKIAFVALEAVTIWVLIRLLDRDAVPRGRAMILAWSPLAANEIAGSGHIDAVMMALVVLALLLRQNGARLLSGVALGLAILTKFLPLAVAPALWPRWDWRMPAVAIVTMALGYLVYGLGAGPAVLGFLPGYAGEEGIRDGSGFWWLRIARAATGLAIPNVVYLVLAALVLGALALQVVAAGDRMRPARGALRLASATMLALTPIYPWYFVWLLPLLCLDAGSRLAWPVLWLTAAGPLLYFGDARLDLWQADLLYGGFIAVALASAAIAAWAPRREARS